MENLIEKAREFSYNKHNVPQECKRYGNAPYSVHLENVVEIGKKYINYIKEEDREDVICSLFCHDLIEDSPVTPKMIRKVFNERISQIVFAVTNERGFDRKEINFLTYPKIWKDELAIFVKLCDRISNTKTSKDTGYRMYDVYKKEYPTFRYALKIGDLYPDMWSELDELNGWKD